MVEMHRGIFWISVFVVMVFGVLMWWQHRHERFVVGRLECSLGDIELKGKPGYCGKPCPLGWNEGYKGDKDECYTIDANNSIVTRPRDYYPMYTPTTA